MSVDPERLESLMEQRRLGPGELSYRSEVSYDHIYRLRKGEIPNVSAVIVARLAAALGTTVEYLLGITNDPATIEELQTMREEGFTFQVSGIGYRAQLERLLELFAALSNEQRETVLSFLELATGGDDARIIE